MEMAVRNQKSASSSPCEQDRRKETKAKAKETKAKEAKASKPAKAVLDKASCLNCGKTCKLRVCKKCNRAAYCDAECQRTHWPEHKTYCATLDGRQEKLDRKILQLVFRAVNISELKESLALLFECLLDLRNHPENASQFIPTLYFKLVTPDQVPLEHGILLGEPLPETGLIPTLSHVIKPRWDELSALERQEMNRSLPQQHHLPPPPDMVRVDFFCLCERGPGRPGKGRGVASAIGLDLEYLAAMKKHGTAPPSALLLEWTPLERCIMYFNFIIAGDEENKFKLRMRSLEPEAD